MTAKRIAIIGAGLAGLSCATRLQQAGFSVTLFDKSRGTGGRMSTRRAESWQCDHGAQYFTARDSGFRAEVARWIDAGVAAVWQPRMAVLGGDAGHEPDAALERFVGVPRMTAPTRWLADALDVRLSHTVERIGLDAGGWWLSCKETGRIAAAFDVLVLAVPAPQAVPLLQEPAPLLAAVARSANMRACWALMLDFEETPGLPFDAAFVNSGPLRWVARDASKPGRSGGQTWLLHANAEWSQAHAEADPEEVSRMLLEAFVHLGAALPPRHSSVHRWRYADTEPPLQLDCQWDTRLGLGICGDWMAGGKVEGAWRSGQALAQVMLAG